MAQEERLKYLINYLLNEQPEYSNINIPESLEDKKQLLRSLMNVRPPSDISQEFLLVQNQYLLQEIIKKGITNVNDLTPIKEKIYLWQGDITTLRCDAIVSAANNRLLGCFVPCHECIDNAIHTYAGIQLRLACDKIMKSKNSFAGTGSAEITQAYNLPSDYIIHTVGPIINSKLTQNDCLLLKLCYQSCLNAAEKNNLKSIAFCCISTGEYHFPNQRAAEIAVKTVSEFIQYSNIERVIFNVFKDKDYEIYRKLLQTN